MSVVKLYKSYSYDNSKAKFSHEAIGFKVGAWAKLGVLSFFTAMWHIFRGGQFLTDV